MDAPEEAVDFEHDQEFLARMVPLMETYGRYFDSEVRGTEHFPDSGPVLFVGNHSGPNCDPDTPALMAAWYRKNGVDKPLVVLSFDVIFAVPGAGDFFRRLAQVPANPRNAAAALERGAAVLVYPGGLEDIARTWSERNQIVLAGHKGFIKLALQQGVPVIPVVSHGGHESSIVLSRGRRIAKGARPPQIPHVQYAADLHDSLGLRRRARSFVPDSDEGHTPGLRADALEPLERRRRR